MSTVETEAIAAEVAAILGRLSPKETIKLANIVFLTVEETAQILRVRPSTVSTWICHGKIPVRYAGGKPVFLLSELLNWTLPENDPHARCRLPVGEAGRIAAGKLTIAQERRRKNDGL